MRMTYDGVPVGGGVILSAEMGVSASQIVSEDSELARGDQHYVAHPPGMVGRCGFAQAHRSRMRATCGLTYWQVRNASDCTMRIGCRNTKVRCGGRVIVGSTLCGSVM